MTKEEAQSRIDAIIVDLNLSKFKLQLLKETASRIALELEQQTAELVQLSKIVEGPNVQDSFH